MRCRRINRRIVDHVADINLPYARSRETISCVRSATGSDHCYWQPVLRGLTHVMPKVLQSDVRRDWASNAMVTFSSAAIARRSSGLGRQLRRSDRSSQQAGGGTANRVISPPARRKRIEQRAFFTNSSNYKPFGLATPWRSSLARRDPVRQHHHRGIHSQLPGTSAEAHERRRHGKTAVTGMSWSRVSRPSDSCESTAGCDTRSPPGAGL